jgi:hypothetical protein
MAYRAFKPEYFDRMLRKAKAGPVPFAFAFDKADQPVLALDEDLEPIKLFAKAKTETGASRGAWGLATLAGSAWTLRCERTIPGMMKGLKRLAKERGWAAKAFTLLDATGKPIGEEAPGSSADSEPLSSSPPPPPDPRPVPLPTPASPPPGSAAKDPADLDDEDLAREDLTVQDPKKLFTPNYMNGLIGLQIQGAREPGEKGEKSPLPDLMRELGGPLSPARQEQVLRQLAEVRGENPDKLIADYQKFLLLKQQQEAVRRTDSTGKLTPVPGVDEDLHGEFMGSNAQLLFGKVVGDAYGIDPVFGALLSPTGGMVGPGNVALHMADDDPTTYHGIVHDAAGYLYNYHKQGPGYDYLGQEDRSDADPLTGQQSGMRYWHEKLEPGLKTTALTGVIDIVYACKDMHEDGERNLLSKAAHVTQITATAWLEFEKAKAKAIANAADAAAQEALRLAEETARKAAAAAQTVQREVEKATQPARDAAALAVEKMLAQAARTGEALLKTATTAKQSADRAVSSLEKAATEVATAVTDTGRRAAESAVEGAKVAKESIGQVAGDAADKLNSAWNDLWS